MAYIIIDFETDIFSNKHPLILLARLRASKIRVCLFLSSSILCWYFVPC